MGKMLLLTIKKEGEDPGIEAGQVLGIYDDDKLPPQIFLAQPWYLFHEYTYMDEYLTL